MAAVAGKVGEAAHAAVVSLTSASPIQVGQSLPAVTVKEGDPTGSVSIHNLPGKIILVGVPGAFTPSCSSQVPGYLEHYEKFQSKGVAGIYVIAVNDTFVLSGWKAKLAKDTETQVHFISDDKASFVSALGLTFDATAILGGPRAKRFTIVVDSGKVEKLFVEEDPTQVTITAADAVLGQL